MADVCKCGILRSEHNNVYHMFESAIVFNNMVPSKIYKDKINGVCRNCGAHKNEHSYMLHDFS